MSFLMCPFCVRALLTPDNDASAGRRAFPARAKESGRCRRGRAGCRVPRRTRPRNSQAKQASPASSRRPIRHPEHTASRELESPRSHTRRVVKGNRKPYAVLLWSDWGASGLLLERERELAAVEALLQGGGGVLVVEGAAGIGKTALVGEACLRAEGCGHVVLRARGSELEAGFAFGVVRQLFERRLVGAGFPRAGGVPRRACSGRAAVAPW